MAPPAVRRARASRLRRVLRRVPARPHVRPVARAREPVRTGGPCPGGRPARLVRARRTACGAAMADRRVPRHARAGRGPARSPALGAAISRPEVHGRQAVPGRWAVRRRRDELATHPRRVAPLVLPGRSCPTRAAGRPTGRIAGTGRATMLGALAGARRDRPAGLIGEDRRRALATRRGRVRRHGPATLRSPATRRGRVRRDGPATLRSLATLRGRVRRQDTGARPRRVRPSDPGPRPAPARGRRLALAGNARPGHLVSMTASTVPICRPDQAPRGRPPLRRGRRRSWPACSARARRS
ncbi:MAG: hypothetical protein H6Q36_1719 [Chloroflexi bacterium]|nr:hypothetical protein [Chloroflexota bacterium]